MPVTDSIAAFSTGTYSVTRRAAGSLSLGSYVPGATTTFSIDASIQPVSGRDVKAAPEGRRVEELRVVYTLTELLAMQPGAHGIGDVVTYKGETWEVIKSEQWPDLSGGEYTRAFIARMVNP
jgi:hypothetical protein